MSSQPTQQYPWEGHEDIHPGEIPEQFNPVASYVKYFTVPKQMQGKRLFVSFQGAESGLAVWLNGTFIGYSEDSFTPSEFELTDAVKDGENKLAVQVFKWTASSWCEDQDFFRFSGIYRDVYLYTVPEVHAYDVKVRAVLQLSHGMVEFIDRYKPLAEHLAGQGILVTGHDHLGHGGSIRTKDDYGFFAQPDGNRAVLNDLHALTVLTKQLYPGVPYFLLGHSMGSFYARQYLCEWGGELDGAILMGTGFQPKALVAAAKALCRVLAVFFGWEHRSRLVASLSFLGYNKGLEGRTPHDWLNRDAAEVDKYRADERCMFTFTLNAYYSMFSGILRLYDPAVLAGMPKDLPLLFLAGDADPVGERTAGVRRAIQSLRDIGVRNIEAKFYPGARHELLMETNKAEVFADIADWLEKQLHL